MVGVPRRSKDVGHLLIKCCGSYLSAVLLRERMTRHQAAFPYKSKTNQVGLGRPLKEKAERRRDPRSLDYNAGAQSRTLEHGGRRLSNRGEIVTRGREFHYAVWKKPQYHAEQAQSAARLQRKPEETQGRRQKISAGEPQGVLGSG